MRQEVIKLQKVHLEDVRGALLCGRNPMGKNNFFKTVSYTKEFFNLWRHGMTLKHQITCLKCWDQLVASKRGVNLDRNTNSEVVKFIAERAVGPVTMY